MTHGDAGVDSNASCHFTAPVTGGGGTEGRGGEQKVYNESAAELGARVYEQSINWGGDS